MEFQLFTVSYRGEGVSAVYGQLTRIYVSYLVFARVPGESYRRRLRSLLFVLV